eukprot:1533474-Rhodomonas_salina.2
MTLPDRHHDTVDRGASVCRYPGTRVIIVKRDWVPGNPGTPGNCLGTCTRAFSNFGGTDSVLLGSEAPRRPRWVPGCQQPAAQAGQEFLATVVDQKVRVSWVHV